MSIYNRRKGNTLPKLDSDSGFFSNVDKTADPLRESTDFGDIKTKSDGTMLFTDEYPRICLDDLNVKELIGAGTQGTVSDVIHIPSGREFAMKNIHVIDKTTLQKTIDEIHSLRKLKHTNVVQLFTVFYQKGDIHILMDLVRGASLGDYIKVVPVVPEKALGQIAIQCLSGLLFMRKNHILHRDLKPSNVMVALDGSVKIADFGLARQLRATGDLAKSFTGTMSYMSPERIREDNYGLKSDVWSLGVILYQCAIGKFPFGGMKIAFWDVNFDSSDEVDVKLPPECSENMRDFISRCLEVDTNARASIEELVEHPWAKEFSGIREFADLVSWVADAEQKRKAAKPVSESK
ncbi:STE family protein kinase [Trichomonas vaginalis G3]|uniref:mitogen-activated protein kinase kinase n=1 Tax=Trichomonas vaginalis (strain ATCC PRA-98 / G3) TaxID=412133 RepID=A2FWP1_TRIV3|nr:MAP kinase kinase protein [Trichomonas vaginalis G3]EAX90669.1 STE family protein kinase [Trichomonas vaginalis G3]KAI5553991.1 MAP kinase kinase protein [Trichomonas vaginalis G3]|eukprot:XP_001303599.1 STE family protein kinase [Trichomonas vaginalis G3]